MNCGAKIVLKTFCSILHVTCPVIKCQGHSIIMTTLQLVGQKITSLIMLQILLLGCTFKCKLWIGWATISCCHPDRRHIFVPKDACPRNFRPRSKYWTKLVYEFCFLLAEVAFFHATVAWCIQLCLFKLATFFSKLLFLRTEDLLLILDCLLFVVMETNSTPSNFSSCCKALKIYIYYKNSTRN